MGRIERKNLNQPDDVRHLGTLEDGALRFESRGVQRLKGLPTPLEVFALA